MVVPISVMNTFALAPVAKQTVDPICNRLLAALPRDEYERLRPHLEFIHLPKNRILYEAGDAVTYAYFLNDGMASFISLTEDGQTIDIGMVGSEGFIGDDLILKTGTTPCRVMTQFPSEAVRIRAEPLLTEFNRGGRLQELLLSYAHVLKRQLVQATICLPFHSYQGSYNRMVRKNAVRKQKAVSSNLEGCSSQES